MTWDDRRNVFRVRRPVGAHECNNTRATAQMMAIPTAFVHGIDAMPTIQRTVA